MRSGGEKVRVVRGKIEVSESGSENSFAAAAKLFHATGDFSFNHDFFSPHPFAQSYTSFVLRDRT